MFAFDSLLGGKADASQYMPKCIRSCTSLRDEYPTAGAHHAWTFAVPRAPMRL